jgi:6-phospho-3-hexuloisomerase
MTEQPTSVDTVTVYAAATRAVDELHTLIRCLDWTPFEQAVATLGATTRVYIAGFGRSGLVGRAIAMRLMHIGQTTYVIGDTTTPSIVSGDLLLAISSTGSGAVLRQAETAHAAGAAVMAITAATTTPLAVLADSVLVVPARTDVSTTQHAGSLFEQSTLILGDALCAALQSRLQVPNRELDRRHANLS